MISPGALSATPYMEYKDGSSMFSPGVLSDTPKWMGDLDGSSMISSVRRWFPSKGWRHDLSFTVIPSVAAQEG